MTVQKETERLTIDAYLWNLAFTAARRSTCPRVRIGCIVVRENGIILSSGYNGSAPTESHCDDIGCDLVYIVPGKFAVADGIVHCQRTIHAEMNAIINGAINGINLVDATWFITRIPCQNCMRAILRLRPKKLLLYGQNQSKAIIAFDKWRNFSLTGLAFSCEIFFRTELLEIGVRIDN